LLHALLHPPRDLAFRFSGGFAGQGESTKGRIHQPGSSSGIATSLECLIEGWAYAPRQRLSGCKDLLHKPARNFAISRIRGNNAPVDCRRISTIDVLGVNDATDPAGHRRHVDEQP
jgi:hypothetical protein